MRQLNISKQVTNRETPSLDKYLHDISKFDLVASEEEVSLSKLIKEGDKKALEKLVNANLRFVVSVAKQYQNQGINLTDLINEGNIGLIKAAKRFDETRGFKFISYAVWWIRQAILKALAEHARIVRLPLNKLGSLNKINRTLNLLEQKYNREPTSEEIAVLLDIAPKEVKDALLRTGRHVSMDAPITQGEEGNMYEILLSKDSDSPDKELLKESLRKEIERAIVTLTYREAYILRHYYGLNKRPVATLEEIGEMLDITRERVRQIKERAIYRLKTTRRCKILKSYI